ncbi:MAG: PLP-dependent aminotransferase family protein [Ardenticatenaceae bacterium]|nr:PLP-dependent aminotransferase family protein [Ardenticatenaceae bacterium]
MSIFEQTINFTRGVPADESFPLEEVAECAAAVIGGPLGTQVMQYGKSFGFAPLREWLAARHNVAIEQVMLANGSLQFVDFMGLALLERGDTVFVESPTYDRVLTLLRRHGARIVGIPLEADGPDLEALEVALRHQVPRLFYIIADFQNPSGATASPAKRRRLAELAERYGFWLVEDAPYRPLRYRGEHLPSLFDLAPAHTLQMSSFTKQISPGVRVGYLIGDATALARLARAAEDTYITPNLIGEATVYEFCRRGWLDPQLDRLRTLYGPRLEAICAALRERLPDAEWIEPDGGFFLSVTVPVGTTSEALRARAAALKLNLSDGRGFFPNPAEGERFLRLPFCALTPDELREAVRRLAFAVNQS